MLTVSQLSPGEFFLMKHKNIRALMFPLQLSDAVLPPQKGEGGSLQAQQQDPSQAAGSSPLPSRGPLLPSSACASLCGAQLQCSPGLRHVQTPFPQMKPRAHPGAALRSTATAQLSSPHQKGDRGGQFTISCVF